MSDGPGSFYRDEVAPGEYAVEIDGSSLKPAIDKAAGKGQTGAPRLRLWS